jgi:hypothetical protein
MFFVYIKYPQSDYLILIIDNQILCKFIERPTAN